MGTKCCVGGCNATSETHRLLSFPSNDELRKLWLSFVVPTNPVLIGLSKEQLVRGRRVCEQHFDRYQFAYNGRRLVTAYPCLFTPNEISHGVPLTTEWDLYLEHNYFKKEDNVDSNEPSEPMTAITGFEFKMEHTYCNRGEADTRNGLAPSDGTIDQPSWLIKVMKNNEISQTSKQKDIIVDQPSWTIKVEENIETSQNSKQKDVIIDKPDLVLHNSDASSDAGYMDEVEIEDMECQLPKPSMIRKSGKVRDIATDAASVSPSNRLVEALNIDREDILEIFDSLNENAQKLLLMQLKQAHKKANARSYTLEEKRMASLLLKQNPEGYKLLESMFTLPNRRTLLRLSEKVKMDTGLNPQLNDIEQNCENKTTEGKLCTIVFDDVLLEQHLNQDQQNDKILAFMLRGICSTWQETVAYYFCKGAVSAAELQNILKQILSQATSTELIPLGLVCNQGSIFGAAIKKLREDAVRARKLSDVHDDGSIEIDGQKLHIFYDPPHLLKDMRNNFMNKDIFWNGGIATWSDILFVYGIDSKLGQTRAVPKLTARHMKIDRTNKMKVSVAAQVLSNRMAAMLNYTNALNVGSATMGTTAKVVEFLDSLFDSVNGHPGRVNKGKLRRAVTEKSSHLQFWTEAIEKLTKMFFVDKNSKRRVKVLCLEGWIITLQSFITLHKILFEKYKIKCYYPGCINQDPLE